MEEKVIKKQLKEFDLHIKNSGVCYINTKKSEIESSISMSENTENTIDNIKNQDGFKSLNSQFNTLFLERGFPELITVKCKNESRFIKFADSDHILYSIIEGNNINYTKVKTQFNKIDID